MGRESAEVIVWLPSLYGSIILPLEGKLIGRTDRTEAIGGKKFKYAFGNYKQTFMRLRLHNRLKILKQSINWIYVRSNITLTYFIAF